MEIFLSRRNGYDTRNKSLVEVFEEIEINDSSGFSF